MSLPQFLAPTWAWLFLLAVPIIVFYFLKLKRPRVAVPSLVLWGQVIQDRRVNSPFQRFKRNLLLLFQLLLLMLIALAAMQPFVDRTSQKSDFLVVMIDNSASMAAVDEQSERSRLDEAKDRVGKLIDQMLPGQRMSLMSVGSTARRLTDFTDNRRVLREALDNVEVLDVPTRLEHALQMTQALARSVPIERALLFSDGNFPAQVDFELPFELDYQRIDAAGPNVGVTALSARSNAGTSWNVFARIESSSKESLATAVELYVDGQLNERKTVVVANGKPRRLVFSVAADKPVDVEVRLVPDQQDSVASDNAALIHVTPLRPLVVRVGDDMHSYRHAIARRKNVVLASDDAAAGRDAYDLLITRLAAVDRPEARVVLTVGDVPADLESQIKVQGGSGEVIDWYRHAPLLEHVLLSDLVFAEEPTSAPGVDDAALEARGYEVLAHGGRGPLILKKQNAEQTLYNILFDTDASTLPYRVGFPVFVSNLLRVTARQAGLAEVVAQKTSTIRFDDLRPETDHVVTNPRDESRASGVHGCGRVLRARSVGRPAHLPVHFRHETAIGTRARAPTG
ncbi:MAG: BatA and WFA domain-containing protein, partial [Pirellulales bacterium]|nr:BatA and WFA domain-containing protein [Pirellulales bacterium]